MEATKVTKMSPCAIVRMVLLVIVLLAGLFWTWFGIASGISEGLGFVGTVMHSLIPGVLTIFLALITMRWPAVGGIQLIAAAIFYRYYFNVCDWFVFGLLVAPLVIAGLWAVLTSIPIRDRKNPSPEELKQ